MISQYRRHAGVCLLAVFLLAGCGKEGNDILGTPGNFQSSENQSAMDKAAYPSGPSLANIRDAQMYFVTVDEGVIKVGVRWPEQLIARVVEIRYTREIQAGAQGFNAVLKNGSRTTFELDYTQWSDGTMARVVEDSGLDRLQINQVKMSDDKTMETYSNPFAEISFEFNPETIQDDPRKEEYLEKFQSFYRGGGTLESNPEGNLLASLVNDVHFWKALENQLMVQGIIPPGGEEKIDWQDVGAGCAVVGYFKCLFGGGVANVICIVCTGIGMAVAVAHLICNIPFVPCDFK